MRATFGFILAVAFTAAPAFAATSVLGNGFGKACYEAAESNRQYRDAIGVCNAALDEDALSAVDRAATFVNRGIILMQNKKLTAAIEDYDAAIKLRPGTAEAYVNKGIALLHLGGRDAEAVALLTEGLNHNPTRPEVAYYTRGIANELIGNTRAAYEDFAKAVELAPNWGEAAAELARFQTVKKKTAAG